MKTKRYMMYVAFLVIGLIIGFFLSPIKPKKTFYVELQTDYNIENVGELRKGTLLKFDQPFSEGFARYILYINIPSSETLNRKDETDKYIISYWLKKKDN